MVSYQRVLLPPEQFKANRLIWYAILLIAVVDVVATHYVGWTLDIPGSGYYYAFIGMCAAVALFHRYIYRDDQLFLFGSTIIQILCMNTALGILSYLAAYPAFPLWDTTFIAIDKSLGFDWLAFIHWFNDNPRHNALLSFSYSSFPFQIIWLFLLMFVYKQTAHAQRYIIIFFFSAVVCIVLSGLFPAVAGYVHYDIDLKELPNLRPAAGRIHEEVLLAIRSHSLHTLSSIQGIVTFPSLHASIAIMLIYMSLPFWKVRIILIPLNIVMLVATIVDGGHWLIDVLAGIVIAFVGIWIAEKLLPRHLSVIDPAGKI